MNRLRPYSFYVFLPLIWVLTFCASALSQERKSSVAPAKKGAAKAAIGADEKNARKSVRRFVVVAPETFVYEKPDLDSKPFGLLPQGTRIPVSRSTKGEFAKFYRTRFKGKLGWVLTIDLKPEAVVRKAIKDSAGRPPPKGPFAMDRDEDRPENDEKKPFIFSQSISLAFGVAQFSEPVEGLKRQAQLPIYGFRILGPDVILTGPIVDFGLLIHYGAPDYYGALSFSKPNGFLLWSDASLLLPIRMRETSWLGVGVGPVLALSMIQTTLPVTGQTNDSFDARIGASLSLTGAVRMDEYLARADVRYIWAGEAYPQFLLGLGTVF